MPDLEAVGDALTGGVVGRAVEPKAGEGVDGHTHETNCLNCGTLLAGDYCHVCGQHAHVHRTLSAFFHDLLHGVLHFEGKIWRTLPLLAWRPGELTRRYIDGQRASFVSPIALFLFSVFLTFAVMGLSSNGSFGQLPAEASKDATRDLQTDQRKIAQLEQRRAETIRLGGSTAKIDRQLTDLRAEAAMLQVVQGRRVPTGVLKVDARGLPAWLRQGVEKARDNPELLFYKLKTNAYKFSWALIPISVPFVWLMFPFSRRFHIYDHTVFVTYSITFMMLLLVASTLVGLVTPSIASLAFFVPPIHMYRQLRGTYAVSRFGATWRTAGLTIFAFIAIGLFTTLLVGIGAFD